MLEQVTQDMTKLSQQIVSSAMESTPGNLQFVDVANWLEDLKKTYTTVEQVNIHDKGYHSDKHSRPDDSEITFF